LGLGRTGAAEHTEIKIGTVENPGMAAGGWPEFLKGEVVEGVDEEVLLGVGDLNEADTFAIMMEAVGLGIESERKVAAEAGDEVVEGFGCIDPDEFDFAL